MKVLKLLFRLLISPLFYLLIFISLLAESVRRIFKFIAYGAEVNVYENKKTAIEMKIKSLEQQKTELETNKQQGK